MHGMRCKECGEVRWSLIGRGPGTGECPICGTAMVPERRRPSTGAARKLKTERRDAAPTGPAMPLSPR